MFSVLFALVACSSEPTPAPVEEKPVVAEVKTETPATATATDAAKVESATPATVTATPETTGQVK